MVEKEILSRKKNFALNIGGRFGNVLQNIFDNVVLYGD